MPEAAQLAQAHWNETPLLLTEQQRYTEYPWLYEVAEFRNHTGERILEVGCGTGADLLQFAKHGAIATGVDITERHLELARARVGESATIVKADMTQLPFESNTFDYVYSHGVVHHSDQPHKAASEILRVLRPVGRFNVHLYARWSESAFIYLLKHGSRWRQHVENSLAPVYIDLYTARRFRKLFPACEIQFSKHQCYKLRLAEPLLGWFIVGKDRKP